MLVKIGFGWYPREPKFKRNETVMYEGVKGIVMDFEWHDAGWIYLLTDNDHWIREENLTS